MNKKKVLFSAITLLASLSVTGLFAGKVAGFSWSPISPPVTPPVSPIVPPITPPFVTNTPPQIYPKRKILGIARQGKFYRTRIWAKDKEGDKIKIQIKGLPKGLNYRCSQYGRYYACKIQGKPRKAGVYQVRVKAKDSKKATSIRKYRLIVKRRQILIGAPRPIPINSVKAAKKTRLGVLVNKESRTRLGTLLKK
jgi:hypothetical protein